MTLNEDFKKNLIVVFSFLVLLGALVIIRITANVPQIKVKQQKKAYIYKQPTDWNLTELENGKRLYYETLNETR
jgi:hypothetical protein